MLVTVAVNSLLKLVTPSIVVEVFGAFGMFFTRVLGFVMPLLMLNLIAPSMTGLKHKTKGVLLDIVIVSCLSAVNTKFFTCNFTSDLLPRCLDVNRVSASTLRKGMFRPCFGVGFPPVYSVLATLLLSFVLNVNVVFAGTPKLGGTFSRFKRVMGLAVRRTVVPLLPFCVFAVVYRVDTTNRLSAIVKANIGIVTANIVLSVYCLVVRCVVTKLITGGGPFGYV